MNPPNAQRKRRKSRRPTLLVGLMTVLVASTVVGAAYFPVSWDIRQKSRRVKSASCLRNIGLATLMYVNAQQSGPAAAPTTGPATQPIDNQARWSRLRAGGYVVFMRHAATPPASGEPANFDLNDPKTQRNLTDAGREQARRVGATLSRENVPVGRVLCSQYFRCRETGNLAFGSAEPDAVLNALPEDPAAALEQVKKLCALAAEKPPTGNLFLVTHQTNILAVTGVRPDPAELVIVQPQGDGAFQVVGRLKAE